MERIFKMKTIFSFLLPMFFLLTCADDRPYLEGHIRRASDAIIVPCDPYNSQAHHSCVVYSSAFNQRLLIYNATAEEMVLAPMGYFPLSIRVGTSTNTLSAIKTKSPKFPFFLALDRAHPGIYVVRSFPSADKKQSSFSIPNLHKLDKKPFKMAAFHEQDSFVVLLSYPDDSSIDLLAFDATLGTFKQQKLNIKIGTRPSHIALSDDLRTAIISDEGENSLWTMDLANALQQIKEGKALSFNKIDLGMKADRIHYAKRDFGLGLKEYVIAQKNEGTQLKLINISDQKVESQLTLNQHPMAIYFPDAQSQPCCSGKEKNWFAVADIKGKMKHIVFKPDNLGAISMSENKEHETDLASKKNMSLNTVHIRKILGGSIEFDSSLERDDPCPNHRRMFYIASYGEDRINPISLKSEEVEAQGFSCEGDGTASRLGFIQE